MISQRRREATERRMDADLKETPERHMRSKLAGIPGDRLGELDADYGTLDTFVLTATLMAEHQDWAPRLGDDRWLINEEKVYEYCWKQSSIEAAIEKAVALGWTVEEMPDGYLVTRPKRAAS